MSEAASETADVIIVGSGPTGSTYACTIAGQWPAARILMLEAGPAIVKPPGYHLSNIADAAIREAAQRAAQGPNRGLRYAPMTKAEEDTRLAGRPDGAMLRRPGLFVVGNGPLDGDGFPAAHAACSVGGMGAQWFGACPRPSEGERIPFIARERMDDALDRAEALLGVSATQFPPSAAIDDLQNMLGRLFDAGHNPDRLVRRMPMALAWTEAALLRTGTDVILGGLLSAPESRFELRSDTVCHRLLVEDDRVVGVACRNVRDNAEYRIGARAVVVAADSLHTPQLLFASGIRPPALGRYLNEHPLLALGLELGRNAAGGGAATGGIIADPAALSRVVGVLCVPYAGDEFPYEIEVTVLASSAGRLFLNIHLYTHSELQWENWVGFSETEQDWLGRPAMRFRFSLSATDRARIETGESLLCRLADALGCPAGSAVPRVTPSGSSLHYQGTMRMGEKDDGHSVCDQSGLVWGFRNLYVAGNGVIPTETAGNPTLTSVALALLGANDLVQRRVEQSSANKR